MDRTLMALGLAAAMLAGCGSYEPKPIPAGPPTQKTAQSPAAQAGPEASAPTQKTPEFGPQGELETAKPNVSGESLKTAEPGVGEKGRGYTLNPISTYVGAVWYAQAKLSFEKAKHDLDLYKAADPQGRGPRTHEEYMEKVIRANGIRLPKLPEGHEYVYDPDQGQLMVKQPKD